MNILLIRSGGIGDCILTLPVVKRCLDDYPAAHADVLGNSSMLEVAGLSGLFRNSYSLDSGEFHTLYSGLPSVPVTAFLLRYDLLLMFSAADGAVRETISESIRTDCRFLDPRPPSDFHGHISQYFMTILGTGQSETLPVLPPLDTVQSTVRNGTVLIHPGSGGLHKNWPVGNFIDLAFRLGTDTGFILGPAEIERGMKDAVVDRGFSVCAGLSLEELAAKLAAASRYIGNDSGISHLAAWAGTYVTVLFGDSDSRLWRPLGENVKVIDAPDNILAALSVDQVMSVLTAIE